MRGSKKMHAYSGQFLPVPLSNPSFARSVQQKKCVKRLASFVFKLWAYPIRSFVHDREAATAWKRGCATRAVRYLEERAVRTAAFSNSLLTEGISRARTALFQISFISVFVHSCSLVLICTVIIPARIWEWLKEASGLTQAQSQ